MKMINNQNYMMGNYIKRPSNQIIFILFCFFTSSPLLGICQNQWQTIKYKDITVQIPSNWGNKNTIYYHEDINVTEHKISAWGKDKVIKSLVIQWIDTEVESNQYIEAMIESQHERFPIFKNLKYDDIANVDFYGLEAKNLHFHLDFTKDNRFEGEYIAFTHNEHTYVVLISGDNGFYKSDEYNHILKSIRHNFPETAQQNVNNKQTSLAEYNFTRYELKNYSLSIPKTMELRGENSLMSLIAEVTADKLETIKKVKIVDSDVVFQPQGIDDDKNFDTQKKALALYSRVLISYHKGKKDEFFRWNENLSYTKQEYNELNKMYKDHLLAEYNKVKDMEVSFNLVSVSDIKIAKNINKVVYIEQQHERSGLNGNIKVINYYLHNNDEMVKLTLSYRISESNLWKKDFDKIIDTFSFTTNK
ncbi:MAG: hypothetical protein PHO95_08435 [Bacteroidales bacterium]|nr:hypothetical protein [Bacteroidales bacterium]